MYCLNIGPTNSTNGLEGKFVVFEDYVVIKSLTNPKKAHVSDGPQPRQAIILGTDHV